jgi:hypothetical protein
LTHRGIRQTGTPITLRTAPPTPDPATRNTT